MLCENISINAYNKAHRILLSNSSKKNSTKDAFNISYYKPVFIRMTVVRLPS